MAKEMTKEEKKAKAEKLQGFVRTNSQMILKEVEKIVKRDLTDEEKESLIKSVDAFFMITTLMLSAL